MNPVLGSTRLATLGAINAISHYVQRGTHEQEWRCDLVESDTHRLHEGIKGRVAPVLVHDFMLQIAVFGNSERSAKAAKAWFDRLPQEALRTWFDLSNILSASKRTYGHEVLRRSVALGDVENDPLAKLLLDRGFLSSPRSEDAHGPMVSVLVNGSALAEVDSKVLSLLIAAEVRSPGCCLTLAAKWEFPNSSLREQAITASLEAGLDVRRWVHPDLQSGVQAQRMSDLSLAVEARRAASDALHALDFPRHRKPGGY